MSKAENVYQQSRRSFLKTSAGAVGGLALAFSPASLETLVAKDGSTGRKPNFVVFLGEGVRYDEFSCTGNPIIQTPNQDRIAREGMTFRNAFVTNALCMPSRASILTGLYSHTTGNVDNHVDQTISNNIPLISDLLRQEGYEVAMFGRANVNVEDRYWDYYFGFTNWIADYYHPVMREGIAGKWSEPKTYDGYVDDLATDRALEWLEQKREKPFCAFVWFNAPHAPFYRPRRLLDLYNGVKIPKPPTFDDDLKNPPYPGKPGAFSLANNKIGSTMLGSDDPRTLEELVKDHYAGVVDNDDNVGRVLDTLEQLGQMDDTAILLTSDHGFFLGEWRFYDKRFMHEPSIRVPLMVRYPRMVQAGSVCEQMALNVDIAPTMLDLAGIRPSAPMQGRSLVPLLQGKQPENWRKDWLYEYYEYPAAEQVRPHRGVRTERHKLIHYYKLSQYPELPEEFELYDLQKDPGEIHNLYGQPGYAVLTQQLLNRISELRKETGDRATNAAA